MPLTVMLWTGILHVHFLFSVGETEGSGGWTDVSARGAYTDPRPGLCGFFFIKKKEKSGWGRATGQIDGRTSQTRQRWSCHCQC